MRDRKRSTMTLLHVAALCISLASCGGIIGLDGDGGGGGVGDPPPSVSLPDGIEQHVTITPESLTVGADIVVRSVLRNTGTVPVPLSSRICGLNWGGNLRLTFTPGVATCGGWSISTTLAVGDSLVSTAWWRLGSPAGEYTLYVGHLLSPSAYVQAIPITIR